MTEGTKLWPDGVLREGAVDKLFVDNIQELLAFYEEGVSKICQRTFSIRFKATRTHTREVTKGAPRHLASGRSFEFFLIGGVNLK